MDKIVTSHVFPPIPMRDFDWSATRDGYEPGNLIGWGKTEREAIDDLLLLEEEREDYRASRPLASNVLR